MRIAPHLSAQDSPLVGMLHIPLTSNQSGQILMLRRDYVAGACVVLFASIRIARRLRQREMTSACRLDI